MRVAIIGQPQSGATTLARVLAVRLGVRAIDSVDELAALPASTASFVLDGIPRTLADLKELDQAPCGGDLDHVLYLLAAFDVRAVRRARAAFAGAIPEGHSTDSLVLPELTVVAERLECRVPVTRIEANGTRTEALTAALAALGLPPG